MELKSHLYWFATWCVDAAGRTPFRYLAYRLAGMTMGEHVAVYRGCTFYHPWKITIGNNTTITNDCFLDARRGITIGSNVSINWRVMIFTEEHEIDSPTFAKSGGPVVIGDRVYIGSGAIILPGVTIGEGAVIGAGAVVTKNVEPWTMRAGVPAKFVRRRERSEYVLPWN